MLLLPTAAQFDVKLTLIGTVKALPLASTMLTVRPVVPPGDSGDVPTPTTPWVNDPLVYPRRIAGGAT